MDIVFLRDLKIETVIGIYDWEREIRQIISIDLDMAADNRKAAATESIEDALNYKAVAKRLIQFVEESEFQLVETLAERIAEIVLDEFDVDWLRLKLGKPGAVTGSREVGVIIERGERS
ncbi:MAG: dihydroneopterin aldolase [Gammaproteobacteria bacterium]|nr:dihydroneopterin aldolase [Gammaproteobacteria bacterium]